MGIFSKKRKVWKFPEELRAKNKIMVFLPENGTSIFLLPFLYPKNHEKKITVVFPESETLLMETFNLKGYKFREEEIKNIIKDQDMVIDCSINNYPEKFLKKSNFNVKVGSNISKKVKYNFIYKIDPPVLSIDGYRDFFSLLKMKPAKLSGFKSMIVEGKIKNDGSIVSYGLKKEKGNKKVIKIENLSPDEIVPHILKSGQYMGTLSVYFEIAYLLNKKVLLKLEKRPDFIEENIDLL